jgi:hypothetical protein
VPCRLAFLDIWCGTRCIVCESGPGASCGLCGLKTGSGSGPGTDAGPGTASGPGAESVDRSPRLRTRSGTGTKSGAGTLEFSTVWRFRQVGGSDFLFKPDGLSGTGS